MTVETSVAHIRITSRRVTLFAGVLSLLASLVIASSAFAAQPADEGFIGRVNDIDAYIAVLSDGSEIRAYVCSDDNFGDWFRGPQNNSELVASSGARLILAFDGQRSRGVYTSANGSTHQFVADPPSGTAAWYRGDSESDGVAYVGGWIILQDGSMRGFIDQDNRTQTPRPRVSTTNVTPSNFNSTVPGNGIIAILIGIR